MNITINRNESGAFFVLHGDEFADQLTYEEMLGLVAQIAAPATPMALAWLKTADQWREQAAGRAARMTSACDEPQFPSDMPTATEMLDRSPAALREQALAEAVKWDGADDRVRADWTAGEPISAGDRIIDTQGREQVAVEITPINRADVRLKVGDVVACEDRGGGIVEEVTNPDGDNTWIRFGGMNSRAYYASGRYFVDRDDRDERITTLNGRPIIDSEEA